MKTAYATIKGFDVMRALRKGQAATFNLTGDVRGEARIVERAFGFGAGMLAEVVTLIEEQFNLQPVWRIPRQSLSRTGSREKSCNRAIWCPLTSAALIPR